MPLWRRLSDPKGLVLDLLSAGLRRYRDDLQRRIAEILERSLDLGAPPLVLSDQ